MLDASGRPGGRCNFVRDSRGRTSSWLFQAALYRRDQIAPDRRQERQPDFPYVAERAVRERLLLPNAADLKEKFDLAVTAQAP